MKLLSFLLFNLFLWPQFIGCNIDGETRKGTINFRKFDVFYLRGTDSLKGNANGEFVEVTYKNNVPVNIKYNYSERTVTLIFEDSFNINGSKSIYVYTTSNLLGEKEGRHTVYSLHTEEYKDLLFVSLSDTLLTQTQDVPFNRQNYNFDLFLKKSKDFIVRASKGDIDYDNENNKLNKGQFYLKWYSLLKSEYLRDSGTLIMIKRLPQ
jgi:hypothetical protein